MALAEGISIHQYIDDWLMGANLKQQCQVDTHRLVLSCRMPGLDDKFKKKSDLFSTQEIKFSVTNLTSG